MNEDKGMPILYHQEGCGMCRAVEMMLKRKGIQYESFTDLDRMIEMGIQSTPTLEVGGRRYVKKECLDWINKR